MADDPTRKLSDTWPKWLAANRSGHTLPADFERKADAVIDAVLQAAIRDAVSNAWADDLVRKTAIATRGKHPDVVAAIKANIYVPYADVYNRLAAITNERRAQHWATTRDHFKFFAWRTAQAMMFAAIVLGTAYLAHRLEIPLPLSRLGSP